MEVTAILGEAIDNLRALILRSAAGASRRMLQLVQEHPGTSSRRRFAAPQDEG
jgi:hypothetical protein